LEYHDRMATGKNVALLVPAPLSDDRTWSFSYARQYIHPGVAQRFIVVAVDSNYYDYSSGGYDPFGHDAKGNRLDGGVGLFGAVATVVDATFDLIANRDHAIEGDWATAVPPATLPLSLTLYESPLFPGASTGSGLHLWGRARMANGEILAAEASLNGTALQVDLIPAGSTAARRITGTFGDAGLTLTAGRTPPTRYQRIGP